MKRNLWKCQIIRKYHFTVYLIGLMAFQNDIKQHNILNGNAILKTVLENQTKIHHIDVVVNFNALQ